MTAWTIACQALLSMGFLGQEYCSGLPFPPPGALLNLGMELVSSVLAGGFFATEPPEKQQGCLRERKMSPVSCS